MENFKLLLKLSILSAYAVLAYSMVNSELEQYNPAQYLLFMDIGLGFQGYLKFYIS